MVHPPYGGLRAIANTDLAEDGLDVDLYRGFSNRDLARNRLVGIALDQASQNGLLAGRQARRRGVIGPWQRLHSGAQLTFREIVVDPCSVEFVLILLLLIRSLVLPNDIFAHRCRIIVVAAGAIPSIFEYEREHRRWHDAFAEHHQFK